MPNVEDVPLSWSGVSSRPPYVTHNSPTSQSKNLIRIAAAEAAKETARTFSETTDALVEEPAAPAWGDAWGDAWGSAWG